ncbi:hypothetical protein DBADOPDK_03694 [Pseudomonas sp. MM223]|nr:hypothetical protein DBADOPDK_03694 [Pseudomonas sp. MM223]
MQFEAFCVGHRAELRDQWPEQLVKAVHGHVRLDRCLVEPGNVQQVGQQVFGALQGLVGTLHQHVLGLWQWPLAQGRDQQARSVQRLQQVMAGGGQVFVLAAVGGFSGISRLQQFIGTRSHPLLQLVIKLLQALLGQLAFGDVGDKTLHQPFLPGLEQQVHQHIEVAAVLAPQAGFIAVQAALTGQDRGNRLQLLGTAVEQVGGQVGQGKQHCLRVVVAEHARQRRVGGTHAILQAGLENPVHGVFEQPFVAVALGLQFVQAGRELRVMAFARRVVAQPQQPGQCPLLLVRGPRHKRPRHHAGSTRGGW